MLHLSCATKLYSSLAILNGELYEGPVVDVWSLGVLLYALLFTKMPFQGNTIKVRNSTRYQFGNDTLVAMGP